MENSGTPLLTGGCVEYCGQVRYSQYHYMLMTGTDHAVQEMNSETGTFFLTNNDFPIAV